MAGYPHSMNALRMVAVAAVMTATLAGCGSSRDADVERLAGQFETALQGSDGERVCELLSDEAQKELQDASGRACDVAVLESGLSPGGEIKRVRVYGTAAQVSYRDDTLFLGDYPDGWKVIAAGCEKQAGAPYDCQVKGD